MRGKHGGRRRGRDDEDPFDRETLDALAVLGIDPALWKRVAGTTSAHPSDTGDVETVRAARERLAGLIAAMPDMTLRERLFRLMGAREGSLLPDSDERKRHLGDPEED